MVGWQRSRWLAWPACCGGAEFAETAFDTLRGLLPDTDIYVVAAAA